MAESRFFAPAAPGGAASSSSGPADVPPAAVPGGGAPPDEPAQQNARRIFKSVYAVQFSHTSIAGRRNPEDMSKQDFASLLKKCHDDVFTTARQSTAGPNSVEKVIVFREKHSNGKYHFYAGIACARQYSWDPVARLLRDREHVYVSFRADHDSFWSIVTYGAVPSAHKKLDEIDKEPYHSNNKTAEDELRDVPRCARRCDKQRVAEFLHGAAPAPPPKEPRRTGRLDLEDLAKRIVNEEWKTIEAVQGAARAERDTAPELYATVLHMGQDKMQAFMHWVWAIEEQGQPARDRIEVLQRCGEEDECICGGKWADAADWLLEFQGVDREYFKGIVLRALRHGRHKMLNIVIYGAGDAGKSFLWKPLAAVYGDRTFIRRGQADRYPLQGIHTADVCILQDVRYESFGLPWDDWLAWGEGEELMVSLPRNSFRSSLKYDGSAPLLASMCDLFSYPPREATRTGRNVERENRQWRSRWTSVCFSRSLPEARMQPTFPACPRCAATWYLSGTMAAMPGVQESVSGSGGV